MNDVADIDRGSDLRGFSFCVATPDGAPITSGHIPALLPEDNEIARGGYYMEMADHCGGVLYLSASSAPHDPRPSDEPLLFGMTWAEIQAKQQGTYTPPSIQARMPAGAVEVYRAAA